MTPFKHNECIESAIRNFKIILQLVPESRSAEFIIQDENSSITLEVVLTRTGDLYRLKNMKNVDADLVKEGYPQKFILNNTLLKGMYAWQYPLHIDLDRSNFKSQYNPNNNTTQFWIDNYWIGVKYINGHIEVFKEG